MDTRWTAKGRRHLGGHHQPVIPDQEVVVWLQMEHHGPELAAIEVMDGGRHIPTSINRCKRLRIKQRRPTAGWAGACLILVPQGFKMRQFWPLARGTCALTVSRCIMGDVMKLRQAVRFALLGDVSLRSFFVDVFLPFIWTRAALLAVGDLASLVVPLRYAAFRTWTDYVVGIWCRWDCGWYMGLARTGYMIHPLKEFPHQANWAFFPLWPLLIRAVAMFTFDAGLAAVILSNVLALVALTLLYRLTANVASPCTARRTVFYMLIYPTSMYLSGGHTESLFLACSLGVFVLMHNERIVASSAVGFLASLTRPQGMILAAPVAYSWFRTRRTISGFLALGLIPLGLGEA